ncbi:Uncharacterised protein [Mycobacteroides abscessus]|nr:Uncharacterised protein [Mycobacteroides abscessus]SKK68281.1 Uncharacterised protein [Mycobacteroides abscessus subsp. massiliense]CPU28585.1 Uncharacterised protein [Mycobacteroides abscessus]SKQ43463.1 Uncharacterised protein [Mycobacteroides abscessus subsp. massiliense]SKR37760.1 Uncharacterised protein [Mycobacteroides abscessus subsp. massiliense]
MTSFPGLRYGFIDLEHVLPRSCIAVGERIQASTENHDLASAARSCLCNEVFGELGSCSDVQPAYTVGHRRMGWV